MVEASMPDIDEIMTELDASVRENIRSARRQPLPAPMRSEKYILCTILLNRDMAMEIVIPEKKKGMEKRM
ncbi:MAG: hypothetical protein A2889_05085 [Nitrospinae bacterium RIFCSPLOWO2_01_FULL_39_10]|nr:MAG: hypothetical protein A2889_05085 [Nitrospinae bacterium RIFCSPLOWO2_01_FULL_39_10]